MFIFDPLSILLAVLLVAYALLQHWRIVSKYGFSMDDVVVGEREILSLHRFTRQTVAKQISVRFRLRELLMALYVCGAIFCIFESFFDVIPNLSKDKVVELLWPAPSKLINILYFVFILFVIDQLLTTATSYIVSRRATDLFKTNSVTDQVMSVKSGMMRRDAESVDAMFDEPDIEPMSPEFYAELVKRPSYALYLARRQAERVENSHDVDPTDGGETDEEILAQYLAEKRFKGG